MNHDIWCCLPTPAFVREYVQSLLMTQFVATSSNLQFGNYKKFLHPLKLGNQRKHGNVLNSGLELKIKLKTLYGKIKERGRARNCEYKLVLQHVANLSARREERGKGGGLGQVRVGKGGT